MRHPGSVRAGEQRPSHFGQSFLLALAIGAAILTGPVQVEAADHGDTALLRSVQRHDARITDLFAFIRNENLVLAVGLDPTVPPEATDYRFSPSLTVKIKIDRNSEVRFDNPDDLAIYGGTIVRPEAIREDIVFTIAFDKRSQPTLKITG